MSTINVYCHKASDHRFRDGHRCALDSIASVQKNAAEIAARVYNKPLEDCKSAALFKFVDEETDLQLLEQGAVNTLMDGDRLIVSCTGHRPVFPPRPKLVAPTPVEAPVVASPQFFEPRPASTSPSAESTSASRRQSCCWSITFDGPKHWLLVKEGIHIILDRILLKDNTHLTVRCPLYGRLSRVEKRAAVLKYATALVLRQRMQRDVLVDTISMCVYEACEQEAILEAPSEDDRGHRPRVPFMQKVMGEALEEMLGSRASVVEQDLIQQLLKQRATEAIVSTAVARVRERQLGKEVTEYFADLASSEKPPPVIFDESIRQLAGVDYFLPPVPDFSQDDQKLLLEAIKTDEREAGKETVFAANLKKALKLIRQANARLNREQARVDAVTVGSEASAELAPGTQTGPMVPNANDWWGDQRWVARYCRVSPSSMIQQLKDAPSGWYEHWATLSTEERSSITRLSANETCDVIDNQPLWLSLRGMVGCNLYRDGVWPIISNDGHLSFVKFTKHSKERFWYIDSIDLTQLFPLFMAWARTMSTAVREELQLIGIALAEGRMEDVSRGIQSHLENAIVSFMLFKVVSKSMEAKAERVAGVLGDLLVAQEEREKEAAALKRAKKNKKKKQARVRAKQRKQPSQAQPPNSGATHSTGSQEQLEEALHTPVSAQDHSIPETVTPRCAEATSTVVAVCSDTVSIHSGADKADSVISTTASDDHVAAVASKTRRRRRRQKNKSIQQELSTASRAAASVGIVSGTGQKSRTNSRKKHLAATPANAPVGSAAWLEAKAAQQTRLRQESGAGPSPRPMGSAAQSSPIQHTSETSSATSQTLAHTNAHMTQSPAPHSTSSVLASVSSLQVSSPEVLPGESLPVGHHEIEHTHSANAQAADFAEPFWPLNSSETPQSGTDASWLFPGIAELGASSPFDFVLQPPTSHHSATSQQASVYGADDGFSSESGPFHTNTFTQGLSFPLGLEALLPDSSDSGQQAAFSTSPFNFDSNHPSQ